MREREAKLLVPRSFELHADSLAKGARSVDSAEVVQHATYYDTVDFRLVREPSATLGGTVGVEMSTSNHTVFPTSR